MSYACGCSSMVEPQPSKLMVRVRFPSPAHTKALPSGRVPPVRGGTATVAAPTTEPSAGAAARAPEAGTRCIFVPLSSAARADRTFPTRRMPGRRPSAGRAGIVVPRQVWSPPSGEGARTGCRCHRTGRPGLAQTVFPPRPTVSMQRCCVVCLRRECVASCSRSNVPGRRGRENTVRSGRYGHRFGRTGPIGYDRAERESVRPAVFWHMGRSRTTEEPSSES